jgi:hypothetical protein
MSDDHFPESVPRGLIGGVDYGDDPCENKRRIHAGTGVGMNRRDAMVAALAGATGGMIEKFEAVTRVEPLDGTPLVAVVETSQRLPLEAIARIRDEIAQILPGMPVVVAHNGMSFGIHPLDEATEESYLYDADGSTDPRVGDMPTFGFNPIVKLNGEPVQRWFACKSGRRGWVRIPVDGKTWIKVRSGHVTVEFPE